MSKSFFIDTTVCTGCRGCQVACKQWHNLPAEKTTNRGSYQNPSDLSFTTYKLVRMREEVVDGQLKWLFFGEQCRHCIDPPCLETAGDDVAIFQDAATGAVIYTTNTRNLFADEIIESCPYNIPRKGPKDILAKCDMCLDRVQNGLEPACVKTCPTGTMHFGERDAMMAMANARLAEVRQQQPQARLLDADDVNVVYLTAHDPLLYHEFSIASNTAFGVTRQAALRRMIGPLVSAAARVMT